MVFSKPVKHLVITQLHLIIISTLFTIIASAYGTYYFLTMPPSPDQSDISSIAPHNDLVVQVRILTTPTTINGNTRFIAEVRSVKDQLVTGKIQASFKGMIPLRRGDEVTLVGDLREARATDTFLRSRHVFSQLFITKIMKGDRNLLMP